MKHLKVGDEVFGFAMSGGFAEEVIVDGKAIFPKPPNMDFPIAASFMMAYGTSYHALKDRANLKEGETLVVLGASGGVGLAAVELGKIMGAKVIAAASTDEKLDLCKQYGADATINYTNEDLKKRIKELTDGKGADVVLRDGVIILKSQHVLQHDLQNGRQVVEIAQARLGRSRDGIVGDGLTASFKRLAGFCAVVSDLYGHGLAPLI